MYVTCNQSGTALARPTTPSFGMKQYPMHTNLLLMLLLMLLTERRAGWDDLACKHDVTYKGQDFRDDFHTVELCACCCCCLGTRTAKPEDKSNLPSISLSTTGTNANAHTMSFVGFEMSYVNMLPGISFRTHSFGTFAIHSRQTHCTSD